MENKKKLILLGLIITLFVISITAGLTYAFFTASVTGNDEAKETEITTAVLSARFSDTNLISESNIMPGWSYEKTFTVENTGTGRAYYDILWDYIDNEFINSNDLVYSITCSNGNSNCIGVDETILPSSGENIKIISKTYVEVGKINTYTLRIKYKETGADQNSDQGKIIVGKLMIQDAIAAIALEGQLIDSEGNVLPNTIMELHSTPKTIVTDINGYYKFEEVEIGKHTLYVKDNNDNVIASKEFNIVNERPNNSLNGTVLNVKGNKTKTNAKMIEDEIEFVLAPQYSINISIQNGLGTKSKIETFEGYSDEIEIIPDETYKVDGAIVTCDEGITPILDPVTKKLEIDNLSKNGNCTIELPHSYYCPEGSTLIESECVQEAELAYVCTASGDTVSGSRCRRNANESWKCPPYYDSSGGSGSVIPNWSKKTCTMNYEYIASMILTYSCSGTYTLEGSFCYINATQDYQCPEGWNLDGTNCKMTAPFE